VFDANAVGKKGIKEQTTIRGDTDAVSAIESFDLSESETAMEDLESIEASTKNQGQEIKAKPTIKVGKVKTKQQEKTNKREDIETSIKDIKFAGVDQSEPEIPTDELESFDFMVEANAEAKQVE
jgi:hypothetical protein